MNAREKALEALNELYKNSSYHDPVIRYLFSIVRNYLAEDRTLAIVKKYRVIAEGKKNAVDSWIVNPEKAGYYAQMDILDEIISEAEAQE